MVNGPSEFRICHCRWFNEKAEVTIELWRIEERTRGIFGYSWKTLGAHHWSSGGSYWMPTEFESLEDARAAIERIKNRMPRNEWVVEPV